jgi:hypothetical protein
VMPQWLKNTPLVQNWYVSNCVTQRSTRTLIPL